MGPGVSPVDTGSVFARRLFPCHPAPSRVIRPFSISSCLFHIVLPLFSCHLAFFRHPAFSIILPFPVILSAAKDLRGAIPVWLFAPALSLVRQPFQAEILPARIKAFNKLNLSAA